MTRHLCLVHGNVDASSAIGLVCSWHAKRALASGWRVSLVARSVDPDLRGEVEVIPYPTLPRIHLAQWAAARFSVRRALAGRTFDIVHVHEPQLASLADVWQVHFLSRAALAASLDSRPSTLKQRVQRCEYRGVRLLEDQCCRRLPPEVRVVFGSTFLRTAFEDAYGARDRTLVLENAAPHQTVIERSSAGSPRLTLGYLGGADDRKGWIELLQGVAAVPDLDLLLAGTGSEDLTLPPGLESRGRLMGRIHELDSFFSQIDALIVPSRFDPFALVVLEAAARSIPTIVSPNVGAGELVRRHQAGLVWDVRQPLAPVVAELEQRLPQLQAGARALRNALDEEVVWKRWFDLYEEVASRGGRAAAQPR